MSDGRRQYINMYLMRACFFCSMYLYFNTTHFLKIFLAFIRCHHLDVKWTISRRHYVLTGPCFTKDLNNANYFVLVYHHFIYTFTPWKYSLHTSSVMSTKPPPYPLLYFFSTCTFQHSIKYSIFILKVIVWRTHLIFWRGLWGTLIK